MNYPKQLLNLMIIAYFWPIQPWLDHDGPLPMRPGGHYQHWIPTEAHSKHDHQSLLEQGSILDLIIAPAEERDGRKS